MEYIQWFLEFIKDNAGVISIVLTIFMAIVGRYSKHLKKYKVIKYSIMRSSDCKDYYLFFWNASYQPIYSKDIYYLKIIGNGVFGISDVFSSDINISVEKNIKTNKTDSKTVNIKFDFLCPREGYMLKITNYSESAKIGFVGRLYGEDRWSVQYGEKIHSNKVGRVMNKIDSFLEKIVKGIMLILIIVFSVEIIFVCVLKNININEKTILISMCSIFIVLSIIILCLFKKQKKSYKLKLKIKEVLKIAQKVDDVKELLFDVDQHI